jgi:hypothetical protein
MRSDALFLCTLVLKPGECNSARRPGEHRVGFVDDLGLGMSLSDLGLVTNRLISKKCGCVRHT